MKKAAFSLLVVVTIAAAIGGSRLFPAPKDTWSEAEVAMLRSPPLTLLAPILNVL